MKTKTEFLAELRKENPKNGAIQSHIAKVEKMSETEFAAHLVRLEEMRAKFAPTAARLAKKAWAGK